MHTDCQTVAVAKATKSSYDLLFRMLVLICSCPGMERADHEKCCPTSPMTRRKRAIAMLPYRTAHCALSACAVSVNRRPAPCESIAFKLTYFSTLVLVRWNSSCNVVNITEAPFDHTRLAGRYQS